MRYVSTFSGIEAASVAWDCLGWEPMAFCEIDQFPSAVLAERYPGVPNLGDMTKVDWRNFAKRNGKPDLLVGGSPCQSFSIAGTRTGLDGASGLMWEYVRAVRELRPRWILWENVPGALSSTHGEDFRCLLEALDGIGYGLAWQVLDAQFFGVAQRRRRVFLVGHFRERPPVEVLFEPDGLRWDTPQGREKRKELAEAAGRGARCAGFKYSAGSKANGLGYEPESSNTLTADWHAPDVHLMHQNQGVSANDRCVAIQGSMIGRSDANGPNGSGIEDDGACYTLNCTDQHAVLAFAQNMHGEVRIQGDGTLSGALSANPGSQQTTYVCETANTGSNGLGVGESDVMSTLDTNASSAVAYALKLRHTGSENKGGGQGPLVQEDVSATLATSQDQTIFQPLPTEDSAEPTVYGLCSMSSNSMKSGNPHSGIYVAETSRTLDVTCSNPSCNQGGMMVVQERACETQQDEPGAGSGRTAAIPINEMVATRGGKLGRGTGFGVGEEGDPANTISASHPHAVAVTQYGEELGGTLTARFDSSPCADRGQNVVCLGDDNAKASCDEEMSGSLKCGGSAPIAASPAMVVRRLTPTECERLQGFPDGWTKIPYKGKPANECPDGPRYKAIGNSMAVPVMRWIGERIDMFERGEMR